MLVTARSLGRNAMVFLYAEQKIFACKALIFVRTQLNVTEFGLTVTVALISSKIPLQ